MFDLKDAFNKAFPEAEIPEQVYLSLYEKEQRYGGPEEGGWWYTWYTLCSYMSFPSREVAEEAENKLKDQVAEENRQRETLRHKRTANMPEGPDPYLDTEGYIPRNWGDGGEYRLFIEESIGSLSEEQSTPHYC